MSPLVPQDEMPRQATIESFVQIAGGVVDHGVAIAERVAFWLAVSIPALYLPLLVAVEFDALAPEALVGVVGVNAVALLLGHSYHPRRRTEVGR